MSKLSPITLDYGASVPMDERTHLTVNEPPPPDLPKYIDYVPSAAKISNMAKATRPKPVEPPDVVMNGSDFVPSDTVKEIRDRRKEMVKNLAKAIYAEDEKRRVAWSEAQAVVAKMTIEQKASPNKDQALALQLLSGGTKLPITIEQAVAKAR